MDGSKIREKEEEEKGRRKRPNNIENIKSSSSRRTQRNIDAALMIYFVRLRRRVKANQ